MPKLLAKELCQALHLGNPQNLFQRMIHCGGISLETKLPRGLLQQLLMQQKICALHVYSVAALEQDCLTNLDEPLF